MVSTYATGEEEFSSSLDKRMRELSEDSQTLAERDRINESDSKEGSNYNNDPSRDSFSDAEDDDIAAALASRIEGNAGASAPSDSDYLQGMPPCVCVTCASLRRERSCDSMHCDYGRSSS